MTNETEKNPQQGQRNPNLPGHGNPNDPQNRKNPGPDESNQDPTKRAPGRESDREGSEEIEKRRA